MNAEARATHALLVQQCEQGNLPSGWSVEAGWPWKKDTHLIAPERRGGVIVSDREISVQLPGHGPASSRIQITDDDNWRFTGRGWQQRLVDAAVRAAEAYHTHFTDPSLQNHNYPAHQHVRASELP